jgi:hypothetical protein
LFFIAFALAAKPDRALAQPSIDPKLNCNILLNAVTNRQVSADFYNEICGDKPDVRVNNLFSTANIEQIVQSVAKGSLSLTQQIKYYGSPERIIALLGQQPLDRQCRIRSGLNWRFYHNLIDYITPANLSDRNSEGY